MGSQQSGAASQRRSAAGELLFRIGLAAFEGDATFRELLRRAELPKAREVSTTVGRDGTAILTTLTVRQLNHNAHVVIRQAPDARASRVE
jgi:voltage-gated potassium channel